MTQESIKPVVSRVVAIHSTLSTNGVTITSHLGVGKTVTISVPSGYKFIAHVNTWHTGVAGIISSFDNFSSTPTSVPVFLNNTTNSNITIGAGGVIHVLSLYEAP